MLDAKFYDKLSRMHLSLGYKSNRNLSGNRKSVQKGSSAEFSDFREYMPGDDLRRVDWNAYGRLDRLYIKEYMEEKEAVVTILIDTSASMNYGHIENSEEALGDKAKRTLELAAALSYMALCSMDRVRIYDMKKMNSPYQCGGGKKGLPGILHWLNGLTFSDEVDIQQSIYSVQSKGAGLTIVISDFLAEKIISGPEEEVEKIFQFLSFQKQKVVFLQVMAKEELDISMSGTYNLIDMEKEDSIKITMDAISIQAYQKMLQDFLNRIRHAAAKTGSFHVLCRTDKDLYQLLIEDMKVLYDI